MWQCLSAVALESLRASDFVWWLAYTRAHFCLAGSEGRGLKLRNRPLLYDICENAYCDHGART